MQTRKLGRHDLELTILGFGGVVVSSETQADADAMVARAFDHGVRYFDVAPQYGDAQQRMGPALEPYRDQCALACKTLERTAEGAQRELDDSLTKLRTDHFDIYQMHALSSIDQINEALADGGAIETFLKAREQGKTRFIGFSAHDEDAAMIAIDSGHFDTVLFPFNYVTFEHGEFGQRVLQAANERRMGIMALKSMARSRVEPGEQRSYAKCWYHPEDRPHIMELLLRYTLSLPGVTAAIPPGDPGLFEKAVAAADRLTPIDNAALAELEQAMAEYESLFPLQPA